jgi:urease accessory protein
MRRAARLALALACVGPSATAQAHPVLAGAGSFYGGLLHPLLVPAHAMAVLALGLLIVQQAPRWRWVPAAYAAGLAAGFAAMMSAVSPLLATEALLAAAAATGGLLALARALPALAGYALALATGAALALDSSPGGISVREANVTIIGTFCGAVVFLLAVAELMPRPHREWQKVGARILGSWIAASAVLVLSLRLAR